MRYSAKTRLEIALQKAGCRYDVPEELIEEASNSNNIDIKIACFNQWAEETEEMKKEIRGDLPITYNYRKMPREKAIAILSA